MSNLSAFFKNFFTTRRAGYYVGCAAAVLSIIAAIVYGVGYSGSRYWSPATIVLLVIGIVAFIALSFIKPVEKLAPIALFVLDFCAFLNFINTVYMYLSEVFYNGVDASSLALLDPFFVWCVILLLISPIVANVACWMKLSKHDEKPENSEAEKEAA